MLLYVLDTIPVLVSCSLSVLGLRGKVSLVGGCRAGLSEKSPAAASC